MGFRPEKIPIYLGNFSSILSAARHKKTPRFEAGGLILIRNSGWGCTKESPNQVLQDETIVGSFRHNNKSPIIVGHLQTGGAG